MTTVIYFDWQLTCFTGLQFFKFSIAVFFLSNLKEKYYRTITWKEYEFGVWWNKVRSNQNKITNAEFV